MLQSQGPIAEKLFVHMMLDSRLAMRGLPPNFHLMLQDAFCRFGTLINISILKGNDAFCRFGNLINISILKGTSDCAPVRGFPICG